MLKFLPFLLSRGDVGLAVADTGGVAVAGVGDVAVAESVRGARRRSQGRIPIRVPFAAGELRNPSSAGNGVLALAWRSRNHGAHGSACRRRRRIGPGPRKEVGSPGLPGRALVMEARQKSSEYGELKLQSDGKNSVRKRRVGEVS